MPQDAYTLRFCARELAAALTGGKINKIVQPDREELSFIIYTGKRTVKLTVNANASECGVYFTEDNRENPLTAPNFCMLLRKHLQGAEILNVETVGFERVIRFTLMCNSDFSVCERQLYIEVMGKYSNVILTEKDVILGALKMTGLDENCKRLICAGVQYSLPAPQEKVNPSNISALKTLLSSPIEGDTARYLFLHVAGLAPCTAEQIVAAYAGGNFAEHVHSYIFAQDCAPCVLEQNGKPIDFYAQRVSDAVPFETLSAAQSYFYNKKREARNLETLRRKLFSAVNAALKKQEKRLAQILERQRECATLEENRIKGELITANLFRLERGMKSCELVNYYDATGGTIKIVLDAMLTPAQNAQAYYKKYQKQRRTLEAISPQEKEIRAEKRYSESLLAAITSAASEADLHCVEEEMLSAELLKAPKEKVRKKKAEIPFRSYEINGFRVLAGRNNLQNDRLVRLSAPTDIWLHAQKYHSCHVVIKTENGRPVPDEVLKAAGSIAARFSDGKGDKIAVDYCAVKYVKKPPKSKAGFVVYTDYQTLLADPDFSAALHETAASAL